ncbi:hypothetical protein Pint_19735 [Pistacia integerrima]|uniref:Uncharacterized protein n=1 Tax=Pistacia integerrima TaxID=434235 RepID=A0ACC0XDZ1_9ROSI|nr:hypothetical protein Pint_19735 [Pistacia integerrima]
MLKCMEQTLLNRQMEVSLRKLCLVDVYVDDQMIENLFARWPLIEYLTIESSKGFKSLELFSLSKLREVKIRISNPSLKELIINGSDLVDVKLETPNLSIFKFRGHPISFISNAMALSETDLYVYGYSDIQDLVKYIELLANFKQCSKVLNLQRRMGAVGSSLLTKERLLVVANPFPSHVGRIVSREL